MNRRFDIQAILADPTQRRQMMVQVIIATQAREGITTTQAQAEAAYDKVQLERAGLRGAQPWGSAPGQPGPAEG